MCSVNDDLLDSITAQNILVHCSVQRYHCKLLAIGSRVYSYTLVSERVSECSVIDDVFCGSELDYFRASTPPIADIGDRNTFLRRSLQPMAIGAHVHVREHGPTQVDFNCFACSHGCCTRGLWKPLCSTVCLPYAVFVRWATTLNPCETRTSPHFM